MSHRLTSTRTAPRRRPDVGRRKRRTDGVTPTPAAVVSRTAPISLATEITREHEAACRAVRSGLAHARRAGDLLLEVKAGLEHGVWLPWLAEHCPTIAARTAQAYMRIAQRWPELEATKASRVADLPMRQALALLADAREQPDAHDAHPMVRLAEHLDALCDEADRDEVELDHHHANYSVDRPLPRGRAARIAELTQVMSDIGELTRLRDRAFFRKLRAERVVGMLLHEAAAAGWTWASVVLAMDDGAFGAFLDLCEARIAEVETAS